MCTWLRSFQVLVILQFCFLFIVLSLPNAFAEDNADSGSNSSERKATVADIAAAYLEGMPGCSEGDYAEDCDLTLRESGFLNEDQDLTEGESDQGEDDQGENDQDGNDQGEDEDGSDEYEFSSYSAGIYGGTVPPEESVVTSSASSLASVSSYSSGNGTSSDGITS